MKKILLSIFTLASSIDTLTYNDLPNSIDSTQSITELNLDAIIKDANGVALQFIPVKFSNATPTFGTLVDSVITSNSYGVAQNQLVNIYPDNLINGLGTITINAQVFDVNDEAIVEGVPEGGLEASVVAYFPVYPVPNGVGHR